MRRGNNKVVVYVYPDEEKLHHTFYEMYKRPCETRAWYVYATNTIYLNVDDVHEGILAHELAHSIIRRSLLVRPPKATTEILARYVDENLFY